MRDSCKDTCIVRVFWKGIANIGVTTLLFSKSTTAQEWDNQSFPNMPSKLLSCFGVMINGKVPNGFSLEWHNSTAHIPVTGNWSPVTACRGSVQGNTSLPWYSLDSWIIETTEPESTKKNKGGEVLVRRNTMGKEGLCFKEGVASPFNVVRFLNQNDLVISHGYLIDLTS